MTKKIFPLLALAALFAACSNKDNPGFDTPTIPDGDVKQNIVENTQYGSYIDWQTYAGDDFYRYATGAWQDATDLGDRNVVGTLQVQDELMDEFLAKVCKGGCPPLQRLFTQYKGTDDNRADKQKVKDKLADIADNVTTMEQAWKKMAELLKEGYALPFDYTVGVAQRKTYVALTNNEMLAQTNADDMKEFVTPEEGKAIMASAEIVWPNISSDDNDDNDDDDEDNGKRSAKRRNCIIKPLVPVSLCQKANRAGENIDNTPVVKILRELGLKIDNVIADPTNLQSFNKGLEEASLNDIKNFMKYCVISRDRRFVANEQKASDVVKTLLAYSNTPLNLLVSRYYCENNVNPRSKTAVKEMGEMLRQTFMNRIERNTWLDAESKAGAKEKLKKMIIQVGWPDQWDESAEMSVKDDASMNTFDLICDLFKQRSSKMVPALAGKTDADHIFMVEMNRIPAWDSNAFYSPSNNEVLICASNLIPPIYDPSKDIIYNYAMMGAPTLGHEITHGFDAEGSESDATGAIREWMSPQSRAAFKSLTAQVVEHYDGWEYYPKLRCNGPKTEVENTADIGGLCIAYEALMAQQHGSVAEKLYVAREYYRAFAYGWMEKGGPIYYLGYVLDNHAPGSLRVNGTVREMDEFYEAFGIRNGAMYLAPEMRLHIW
jgi:predicted metalloendopeptidase